MRNFLVNTVKYDTCIYRREFLGFKGFEVVDTLRHVKNRAVQHRPLQREVVNITKCCNQLGGVSVTGESDL